MFLIVLFAVVFVSFVVVTGTSLYIMKKKLDKEREEKRILERREVENDEDIIMLTKDVTKLKERKEALNEMKATLEEERRTLEEENNTLEEENNTLEDELDRERSNIAIGFSIRADPDTNPYALAIIKSMNRFLHTIKVMICKTLASNLSGMKMNIKDEMDDMTQEEEQEMECSQLRSNFKETLAQYETMISDSMSNTADLNKSFDAFLLMINTVLDQVCRDGMLSANSIEETINQMERSLCGDVKEEE